MGQTYSGKDLLLLTPLVKYYVEELGIKVVKIHQFIQYYPGRCFEPFTSKGRYFFFQIIKWIVTHLRNQARQEGNKTKGLTAKLIGKNLIFSSLTPL